MPPARLAGGFHEVALNRVQPGVFRVLRRDGTRQDASGDRMRGIVGILGRLDGRLKPNADLTEQRQERGGGRAQRVDVGDQRLSVREHYIA